MTFADWLRNTKQHLHRSGLRKGGKAAASEFYTGAALRVFNRIPGTFRNHVFDEQWDVCVVLDACRYDAFCAVAPEYEWLPDEPASIKSMGSMSEEWMQASFHDGWADEMAETGHITWNAYSNFNLDADDWAFLDEVWTREWDDDRGLLPPRAITEQAIRRWREDEPERMLVHYMQPHTPYRQLADDGVIEPLSHECVGDKDEQGRLTVWKLLRRGEISHDRAWGAYLDNLRWVLDDIETLVENIDADRVVITADHGDCFGEWGGIYGHPKGVPAPELVTVPWAETTARDTHTLHPAESDDESVETDAEERLEALGYI